jgi:hypothetical protein
MARASLNTVRQQLTSGSTRVGGEREQPQPRMNPVPRVTIPPLSTPESTRIEEPPSPALNDLRAAVDALKKPRRVEAASEPAMEPAPEPSPNETPPADDARPEGARRA